MDSLINERQLNKTRLLLGQLNLQYRNLYLHWKICKGLEMENS